MLKSLVCGKRKIALVKINLIYSNLYIFISNLNLAGKLFLSFEKKCDEKAKCIGKKTSTTYSVFTLIVDLQYMYFNGSICFNQNTCGKAKILNRVMMEPSINCQHVCISDGCPPLAYTSPK